MDGYLGEFKVKRKFSKESLCIMYLEKYAYRLYSNHHKQWLLDQLGRILLGTEVFVTEVRWKNREKEIRLRTGEPSKEYIEWMCDELEECYVGIAPGLKKII